MVSELTTSNHEFYFILFCTKGCRECLWHDYLYECLWCNPWSINYIYVRMYILWFVVYAAWIIYMNLWSMTYICEYLWSNPWLKYIYIWIFMPWFVNEIYVMRECYIQMFSIVSPYHVIYGCFSCICRLDIILLTYWLNWRYNDIWHLTRLVPSKPKKQNGVESWLYYDQNDNDMLFEQFCN